MKLRVIGCAGGFPMGDLATSSYLLTDNEETFHLLLDAGSGSLRALEQYIDPNHLQAIIVSHDHADHTGDIAILQHVFLLKKPQAAKLPIAFYFHPDSHYSSLMVDDAYSIVKNYSPGETLDLGPFEIEFKQTRHPVTCYAMRIKEKESGKVLVYTADSGWQEDLVDFCQGADLLVADCNFTNEIGSNDYHMVSQETAQLANLAQVKKLIPTHIPPQADKGLILQQVTEALDSKVELQEIYPGLLVEI